MYGSQGRSADVVDPSLDVAAGIYKRVRDADPVALPPDAAPHEVMMAVGPWVHNVMLALLTEIAVREFELRQAGLRG